MNRDFTYGSGSARRCNSCARLDIHDAFSPGAELAYRRSSPEAAANFASSFGTARPSALFVLETHFL
jgi:hypothetical protein